jgi:hypothetical protein
MLMAMITASLLGSCTAGLTPTATTPTGIPYVDKVIEAAQCEDPQAISALFVYREVPCTKEKWLLRQPLCEEGETDGTLVETIPILSSDLGHHRKKKNHAWPGMCESRLYAVYRTGPYTYADEFYPAGEYAVAFLQEGSEFATIFQVTREGIVRIDYCGVRLDICSGSTIEEIFQENKSAFVLGPLPVEQ